MIPRGNSTSCYLKGEYNITLMLYEIAADAVSSWSQFPSWN